MDEKVQKMYKKVIHLRKSAYNCADDDAVYAYSKVMDHMTHIWPELRAIEVPPLRQ